MLGNGDVVRQVFGSWEGVEYGASLGFEPHSVSSPGGCSDGGDIAGGVEFAGTVGSELEHARECGDRGRSKRGS